MPHIVPPRVRVIAWTPFEPPANVPWTPSEHADVETCQVAVAYSQALRDKAGNVYDDFEFVRSHDGSVFATRSMVSEG